MAHTKVLSSWYLSAMERLVDVVRELSQARDVETVTSIVRIAARELTGADGATFILRDNNQCYYAEENAIAPLWKGKRFPVSMCVSGWVMLNSEPALISDIYKDPRVPTEAYRPTFVKSLAMVPIRRNNPIGAIGNYWATNHSPTEKEVAILQALADTTSVALENSELYNQLQKQVETLREQSERIGKQHESLEIFTHALAHDLKEPVRTMTSFSHLINEGNIAPKKQEEYMHYIRNASERMSMLIDSVFQYTQLDNPDNVTSTPCPMSGIMDGVLENLSQLIKEREATVNISPLPEIQASPAHMMQLMQNLVTNSILHNDKGVSIEISAQERTDDWLFTVHDNGNGITPEQLTKIFQPFTRLTHKEGCSGLGLAICHKIITSYGGDIGCESSPGKGSTFYFNLPKTKASAGGNTLANVLLVDDRAPDIEITRILLFEKHNIKCNIIIAHDGNEAYKILQDGLQNGNMIDLVLLDINMPGMNGFELLEKTRQHPELKNISVMMCSGSTYEPDRRRAKTLGAAGYIVKPPSFEQFQPLLKHVPHLRLHSHDNINELLRAA